MKLEITKIFEFAAAHYIPEHEGKCKNLHGHTYKLEVTITRTGLSNSSDLAEALKDSPYGMVMDFGDLKSLVKKYIIEIFDHSYLNEIFHFPTAENMAGSIFTIINNNLPQNVEVTEIKLWETPTSCATVKG